MNKKTWLVVGAAVLAVAICAFSLMNSVGSEDVQSNVTEFAKSIDNTKANTPSVPPERLALGRSGPQKGR
jgi:hypothetical protein